MNILSNDNCLDGWFSDQKLQFIFSALQLQGIRTVLNLPLQNQNQNSNGLMTLTGPDMHLVMGSSVMVNMIY